MLFVGKAFIQKHFWQNAYFFKLDSNLRLHSSAPKGIISKLAKNVSFRYKLLEFFKELYPFKCWFKSLVCFQLISHLLLLRQLQPHPQLQLEDTGLPHPYQQPQRLIISQPEYRQHPVHKPKYNARPLLKMAFSGLQQTKVQQDECLARMYLVVSCGMYQIILMWRFSFL